MARESRGLGRGLQALLSAQIRPSAGAALPPVAEPGTTLPLNAIRTGPVQPRQTIQAQPLEELAASIRSNGVIQPIVVRPAAGSAGDGARYEIVAGERRWQAAQLAGLTEIPVVIRTLSDREAVAVALIENIQREELTPAEEARSLKRLIADFALTHQEVADAVGRSRAAVSNLLRLLDLPAEVLALIDAKSLSMGHARALLGLAEATDRVQLARRVVERGLSVRETEAWVGRLLRGVAAPSSDAARGARAVQILRTPSLHVTFKPRGTGRERIVIDVGDAALRDRLIRAIRSVAGSDHED